MCTPRRGLIATLKLSARWSLATQLGVGAEALAPVFSHSNGGGGKEGVEMVIGILALCSNHVLQAHGLYHVEEAQTPAGMARRLMELTSTAAGSRFGATSWFSDARIVFELGELERVEVGDSMCIRLCVLSMRKRLCV